MKLNFKNKRTILFMHILAWAIIFALPYIFGSEYAREKDSDELAFQKIDTLTNL